MVIISLAERSLAEFAAAMVAGMAVEMRPGQRMRLITEGEHAIELDQLGDRVLEALEHRAGPGHPDGIPGPAHFSGSLLEQEIDDSCQPSELCTSATISPDGTMIDPPKRRLTA